MITWTLKSNELDERFEVVDESGRIMAAGVNLHAVLKAAVMKQVPLSQHRKESARIIDPENIAGHDLTTGPETG